jgi:hypothetical protein
VDLAVTVRAEHHALGEFGDDLLPSARDAILPHTKILLRGIAMMEIKDRRRTGTTAAITVATHVRNRTSLELAPESDDGSDRDERIQASVFDAMAARANEIALRSFGREPRPCAVERADGEVLLRTIPIVELERREYSSVPAPNALATRLVDKSLLHGPAALLLIPVRLGISSSPSVLNERRRL